MNETLSDWDANLVDIFYLVDEPTPKSPIKKKDSIIYCYFHNN
jgi:hypothetical protein